jgi:hypothetical protein
MILKPRHLLNLEGVPSPGGLSRASRDSRAEEIVSWVFDVEKV